MAAAAEGGFPQFRRASGADAAWETLMPFRTGDGQVESVAMLQSNFGDPGNLELIAIMHSGGAPPRCHVWSSGDGNWFGPSIVDLSGVPDDASPIGLPSFLQCRHGEKGHFEAVVPLTRLPRHMISADAVQV